MKAVLILASSLLAASISFAGGGEIQSSSGRILMCESVNGPVSSIEFVENTRSLQYLQWVVIKLADGSTGTLTGTQVNHVIKLNASGRIVGFKALGEVDEQVDAETGTFEYAFALNAPLVGRLNQDNVLAYKLVLKDGKSLAGKVRCN